MSTSIKINRTRTPKKAPRSRAEDAQTGSITDDDTRSNWNVIEDSNIRLRFCMSDEIRIHRELSKESCMILLMGSCAQSIAHTVEISVSATIEKRLITSLICNDYSFPKIPTEQYAMHILNESHLNDTDRQLSVQFVKHLTSMFPVSTAHAKRIVNSSNHLVVLCVDNSQGRDMPSIVASLVCRNMVVHSKGDSRMITVIDYMFTLSDCRKHGLGRHLYQWTVHALKTTSRHLQYVALDVSIQAVYDAAPFWLKQGAVASEHASFVVCLVSEITRKNPSKFESGTYRIYSDVVDMIDSHTISRKRAR